MAGRDNILGSPMFGGGSLGKSMFPKFSGPDRRKKARLSTDELNRLGLDAPGLKDSDLPNADARSAFTKVLDVLDIPRNAVFNAISWLGDVPTAKLRKGALGMKVVTGSDVLRRLGVRNKAVLGVGGLAADIFGDPLTWLFPLIKPLQISKGIPRILAAGRGAFKTTAQVAALAGKEALAAAPKAQRVASGLLTKLRHVFPTAAEAAAAKAARAAATAKVAASPAAMKVAEAIGAGTKRFAPEQVMARLGERVAGRAGTVESAARELAGRKARGILSRAVGTAAYRPGKIEGARKFITEFGERGHRLFTAPLTEIGGPVLKFGKKARLWKEMAQGAGATTRAVEQSAKAVRALGETASGLGRTAANIEGQQSAAKAGAQEATKGYRQLLKGRYAVMKAGIAIQPPVKEIPVVTAPMRKARRAVDVAKAALDRVDELKKSKAASTGTITDLSKKWGKTPSELRNKFPSVIGKIEGNVAAAKARIPAAENVTKMKAGLAEARAELAAATKAAPKRKLFAPEVEAARARKILAGQDVAAAKTLPMAETKKALAETVEKIKEAKASAIAAQTAPDADLSWRLRTKEMIGAQFPEKLPPGASAIDKARNKVGQAFQRLFGYGQNLATREVAHAKHLMGSGRNIASARVEAEIAKATLPLADDIAKTAGMKVDDVRGLLHTVVESRGSAAKELYRADPAIPQIAPFMAKLNPKQQKAVQELVQRTSDISDAAHKEAVLRGVAGGKQTDPMARVLTKEARAAQIPGHKFADERTMRVHFEITDPAARTGWAAEVAKGGKQSHWMSPTEYMAFSNDKEQLAGLKALVDAGKAKEIGKYQISVQQWNQWRQLGGEAPGGHAFDVAYKGLQFEPDVAKGMGARMGEHTGRIAQAELRDVVKAYSAPAGVEQMRGEGFRHMVSGERLIEHPDLVDSPFIAIVGKQLKGLAIPQPIADMVREAARISKTPDSIKSLFNLINYPLKIWKPLALLAPGYTARNLTQNRIGVLLQGGNPARMTKFSLQHMALVRDAINGKDLAGKMISIEGRIVSADELVRFWRHHNLLQAGMTSMLIEPTTFDKAKTILGKVQSKFFYGNNILETSDRVGAWKEFVHQGYSWREAAVKTTMAMPDLTDLTHFEQSARNFFPWMAWLSHNTRNMARVLAERPQILPGTEHFRHAIEEMATGDLKMDDDLKPNWMQQAQAMQITGNDKRGTVFLLASWLPFNDIMTILEASQSPSEFARGVLGQIRPDVKVFAELATGTNIFQQKPVTPFTTEEMFTTLAAPRAVMGKSGTALDSLLSIRPIREGGRIADMPTIGSGAGRFFIGGAIQPLTRERVMYDKMQALNEKAKKIRAAIMKAKAVSDNAAVASLAKQWAQVQAEMLRLGLPGVAKSTQKSLAGAGVQAGEPAFAD